MIPTRCLGLVTGFVLAPVVTSPARADVGSLWVVYEAAQILAKRCPDEYGAMFGQRPASELDEPIRIIRARETAMTAEVSTDGDAAAAEAAMEAYKANITRQIETAVRDVGCQKASEGIGLGRGHAAPARSVLLRMARETMLPTTERSPHLPAEAQIGTQAAFPLQQLLLGMLADPADRACDPKTARVKPISRKLIDAENVPPFAGKPARFTEAWTLQCRGASKSFAIEFTQDARTWKRYSIHDLPGSETAR